jgi:hypothetical protein
MLRHNHERDTDDIGLDFIASVLAAILGEYPVILLAVGVITSLSSREDIFFILLALGLEGGFK